MLKVGVTVGTWDLLPMPSFVKITKGDIPLWAKIYTKISKSDVFGAISPHFKSHNGENWCESENLLLPPHAKFYKNWLKGIYPFGENLHQKIIETLFMPAKHFHFSLLWGPIHIHLPEGATTLFHNADVIT